jgi:hypothetical protein
MLAASIIREDCSDDGGSNNAGYLQPQMCLPIHKPEIILNRIMSGNRTYIHFNQ